MLKIWLCHSSLALRRNLIQGLQIHYILNSLEIFLEIFFFFAQYFDPKNCIRIGFFVILHQSFVQLNESLKSIFKHSNLFLCGPATQLVVRPSIVQTIPNQSYGLLLLDFDSYVLRKTLFCQQGSRRHRRDSKNGLVTSPCKFCIFFSNVSSNSYDANSSATLSFSSVAASHR